MEKIKNNQAGQLDIKDKEKIIAFSHLAPIFFDKGKLNSKLDTDITIEESRKKFLKKLNSVSLNYAGETYDFLFDASINFWLSFFVFDLVNNDPDVRDWNVWEQLAVVGFGLGFAVVKLGMRAVNFFKNKINPEKVQQIDPDYVDTSLQHRQLERLYLAKLADFYLTGNNLEKISAAPDDQKNLDAEINQILQDKAIKLSVNKKRSWRSKLASAFFSRANSVEEHIEILEAYKGDKQKLEKATTIASQVIGNGTRATFLQWFAGVAAFVSLVVAGFKDAAQKVGSVFNDGIFSTAFSLAVFALGTLLGVKFYKKEKSAQDKAREELKTQYEKHKDDIETLRRLEVQNNKLADILRKAHIEPKETLAPHDDRGFRRLTRDKSSGTKLFTAFKKTMNRLSVAIGKAGSGMLIYRTLPMVIIPLLAKIAAVMKVAALASIVSAFTTVAWPVAIGGLVFSLIWAAMYTYKYINESKINASKRFLNDIQNRIICAERNQDILLKQLNYSKAPPTLTLVDNSEEIKAQPDKVNTKAQSIRRRKPSDPKDIPRPKQSATVSYSSSGLFSKKPAHNSSYACGFEDSHDASQRFLSARRSISGI